MKYSGEMIKIFIKNCPLELWDFLMMRTTTLTPSIEKSLNKFMKEKKIEICLYPCYYKILTTIPFPLKDPNLVKESSIFEFLGQVKQKYPTEKLSEKLIYSEKKTLYIKNRGNCKYYG